MATLKFRAWNELENVMHYDFEFIRSGVEGNDWIIFKSDKQKLEDENVFDNPYPQQQFKIMQSVGLKDNQGKDIYEGDTFEDESYFGYCDKCKGFQEFLEGVGCMACEGDVHWQEIVGDNGKIEITGNIYEGKRR